MGLCALLFHFFICIDTMINIQKLLPILQLSISQTLHSLYYNLHSSLNIMLLRIVHADTWWFY